MTASLTNPVKFHLCDLQYPRPARLGPEMRGSREQEWEPDTHHDVQQERSLRTLLRDTNSRCTGPRDERSRCTHVPLLHFAASLHCFLWNLQQIPGLAFALSCHSAFLCFCWNSSRRVAVSENAVLAENGNAGGGERPPLGGSKATSSIRAFKD